MTAPVQGPEPAPVEPPPRRRISPVSVLLVVVLLGIALMWIYAYSGMARRHAPDYLDDRAWTTSAETTCRAALDRIDALPPAFEARDAAARADVLDRANGELAGMLTTLRATLPAGERDQGIARAWLEDWDRYLANRVDYANRLRTDAQARFYVDQKGAKQVTEPIDGFARSNEMPSCASPDDVT